MMTFETKIHETPDQLIKGHATGGPELGIHADRREARHGIDFVEPDFARSTFKKEIDACQSRHRRWREMRATTES